MCDATTLFVASLAISAASTGYSYYTSNQQADQAAGLAQQQYDLQYKQQQEIYNQQREQEQLALERASQDGLTQLARDQNARAIKIEQLSHQNDLQNTKIQSAQSTASVMAAEGGVGGLSVDALMSDYWRQSLDSRYSLESDTNNILMEGSNNTVDYNTQSRRNYDDYLRNDKNLYTNFQYNLQSLGLGTQSEFARINDARMSPITAGLSFASSAVNSAGLYNATKDPDITPRTLKVSNRLSDRTGYPYTT
jgi:hypothetical protein